ncbi:MAG: nicotinate (nicotinamide) nucleotide adenylyltransferase [Victivallaceae bacterium]|nr:nicotinate (nicotinamide) nucleotide adenylyltransferase [Victivallaceae bacterium]
MRIAFFGGTFDPPHLGHSEIVRRVLENNLTDLALFVPSWSPPHKGESPVTPFFHRMAMLKLAVDGVDGFAISNIEERLKFIPSYTVKILEELDREFPNDQIQLMIGADSLSTLHSWYCSEDLVKGREIIAYPREGFEVDINTLKDHWPASKASKLVDAICNLPFNEVSSTEIRSKISKGENAGLMMEKTVYEYILEHNLYRKLKL